MAVARLKIRQVLHLQPWFMLEALWCAASNDRAWASLALGTSIHFDCAARTKVLAKVLRRRSLRCQDGSLPRSVMVAGCNATQQDKTKSTQTEAHALNQNQKSNTKVMSLLTVQPKKVSREQLSTREQQSGYGIGLIPASRSRNPGGERMQDGLCPQYSHLQKSALFGAPVRGP